jgi:hypothetical protein
MKIYFDVPIYLSTSHVSMYVSIILVCVLPVLVCALHVSPCDFCVSLLISICDSNPPNVLIYFIVTTKMYNLKLICFEILHEFIYGT